MRGRRINNFTELWSIAGSVGLEICVSPTSFQKNDISWPQQPITDKVQKFKSLGVKRLEKKRVTYLIAIKTGDLLIGIVYSFANCAKNIIF